MRARLAVWLGVVTPLGFATKLYAGPGSSWVSGHAGGVLYVVFFVLLVLLVKPGWDPKRVAAGVFALTCLLEVTQLLSTPLLETIRASFLGRALVGADFDWLDLPHYAAGALLGIALARSAAADQKSGRS